MCGDSSGAPPNRLKVWGDFFNADTRCLLAVCKISSVPVTFELVNSLARQNLNDNYTEMNPST